MSQRYFFMGPLLEKLGQPEFFCRLVAVALRATAALIVLLSLTIVFKVGKITFELTHDRALGGILFEVFFALAVYAAVHTILIRARDVQAVRGLENYSISVLTLLLRLLGEAYCVFVGLTAVGCGLFVWFTGQNVANVLGPLLRALFPGVSDESTFISGIEFIASGLLIGLAALVVTYATAQALSLLVRPTRNGAHQAPPTSDATQAYRSRFGS
ncbi:MAG TPA: hypothetical protein VJS66_00705 [Burkholderiales bacterium]|nr:hypothetical protein [Burkholderiales bacterium]